MDAVCSLLDAALAVAGTLDSTELAIGFAAFVLLAAGLVAFLSLLRSYGRLLLRVEQLELALGGGAEPEFGLELGTPAPMPPRSTARGHRGHARRSALHPALPLLVFTSPHCGPCRALLPDVAEWQAEHAGRLSLAVASEGAPADVRGPGEAPATGRPRRREGRGAPGPSRRTARRARADRARWIDCKPRRGGAERGRGAAAGRDTRSTPRAFRSARRCRRWRTLARG